MDLISGMMNMLNEEQNGSVIGPVKYDDWYTMRQLREAMRYMRQRPVFYADAIEKEQNMYEEIRGKYI
jgi:hypothetical protein